MPTPSPPPAPLRRTALRVAGALFVFWVLVLLSGADHPPPPGFLVLVLLAALAAWGVSRRFPAYAGWACAHTRGWPRAAGEGGFAGAGVAALLWALPHPSQAGLPPPTVADFALWVAVLAAAGALQALMVYALAAGLARWGAACAAAPTHATSRRE